MIAVAQDELRGLLTLRGVPLRGAAVRRRAGCARASVATAPSRGSDERRFGRLADGAGGFELPEQGAEIPVLVRGQQIGRFVLEPTPGVAVSLEQRLVAVAIADQVATVWMPERHGGAGGGRATMIRDRRGGEPRRGDAAHLPRRRARASARRSPCSTRAAGAGERGTDVVVGFVETHGRARTAEQIGDLEVVARRVVEHRGSALDRDGRRRRRCAAVPTLVLVDELAHTNAPGSRHDKRWQDVDELLAAGIDVISTVNIQHLESLNDVVERITGIRQRETIPDHAVRAADQIELVDMAPEALRRRLAHGNVYGADEDRRRARQLLPARQPRRPARAGPAVGRRPRRRRRCRTTASATASPGRGRRASASSSPWPARPAPTTSCAGRRASPSGPRAT